MKNTSKTHQHNLKIIGNNADGLFSKKESFQNLLNNEKPTCFLIQETKLKKEGRIKPEGYKIFEKLNF